MKLRHNVWLITGVVLIAATLSARTARAECDTSHVKAIFGVVCIYAHQVDGQLKVDVSPGKLELQRHWWHHPRRVWWQVDDRSMPNVELTIKWDGTYKGSVSTQNEIKGYDPLEEAGHHDRTMPASGHVTSPVGQDVNKHGKHEDILWKYSVTAEVTNQERAVADPIIIWPGG